MNKSKIRAVLTTALHSLPANATPDQVAVAKLLMGLVNKMAHALTSGTANGEYTAIFHTLKASIDEMHAHLNIAFEKARAIESNSKWDRCLSTAKALSGSMVNRPLGPLTRTVDIYSGYEDEQAAYAAFCEATYRLGDLLLSQPRGTYIDTPQGGYFVSSVEGAVQVYETPGCAPYAAADQVWEATHCDGIGASDLNEIRATLEESARNPVFKTVPDVEMLDALVLFNFECKDIANTSN